MDGEVAFYEKLAGTGRFGRVRNESDFRVALDVEDFSLHGSLDFGTIFITDVGVKDFDVGGVERELDGARGWIDFAGSDRRIDGVIMREGGEESGL